MLLFVVPDCKTCEALNAKKSDDCASIKAEFAHLAQMHTEEWDTYMFARLKRGLAKAYDGLVDAFNSEIRRSNGVPDIELHEFLSQTITRTRTFIARIDNERQKRSVNQSV